MKSERQFLMRKLSIRTVLLFGAVVAAYNCSTGEPDDVGAPEGAGESSEALRAESSVVGAGEAEQLAVDFAATNFGRGRDRALASTDVEYDEAGEPSMYVFNYRGGGFLLVAADKRQAPILGFSETDGFDARGLADGRAPEAVRGFVLKTKRYTRDIRDGFAPAVSDAKGFERVRANLSSFKVDAEGPADIVYPPNPDTCTGSYSYTHELNFPVAWNQGCGWNDHAPLASGGPCGRAWAGCVAVATAQIMKYYQYPTTFNWAAMSNTAPQNDSALLLRDVGDRLGTDWGASGSSADTGDVDNVLESYGYSTSASFVGHSFYSVLDEIKAGRPVVMRGTPDCDFWGIPTCGGHAWVVSGVKDTYNCSTGTYPRYYKANWGWGGSYNGWYATHNLNPGGQNYNHHQEIVIGIKKP
jgi:hypothetical protein